jgi:CheY-like chemotaxis protein
MNTSTASQTDATNTGFPVLIVDDDDDHRAGIREVLEDEGYSVVEAADGRQALDYVTDPHKPQPVLILLDLSMPVMTGWELLAIIKSYTRLASIPVILISGQEPMLDPRKHGTIVDFLRKPYNVDTLMRLVAIQVPATARTAG